ncbi:glycosyltransferase family 2 protein [Candidatus Roizmanbacteria bacterium]|nr:glycosyltransferase family 2 protein [Candidatus Roizmanbacteria bacterium]
MKDKVNNYLATTVSNSHWYLRFTEIFVPLTAWIMITMPIWLSFWHPALVAYFIIAFDLYFLYKSIQTAYYATISYKVILETEDVPFNKKIEKWEKAKPLAHFVIIPNYKEPLYKLEDTIGDIVKSDYPFKEIYLVLAFEKREEEAKDKYEALKEKFGHFFKDVIVSYHVLVSNEVPGKASNQTFASRIVSDYVRAHGLSPEETVVTICDADSRLPINYFSYLTYEFIKDVNRKYHFYWAPVFLYNNFWQLPFFVRMQATLSSILRLAFLSQKERLIQLSTYSTNLWLLEAVNYWDVDIIPEDWHIFFQAFFAFGDKVRTIPLYTTTNGDAVYSGNMFKTLVNRYEQEKRWAWGVTDISYALSRLFTTPHIPMKLKLKRIFLLTETHLLWPTSFFILTLSASVPPLVNPLFKRTVLGFILPQLSGLILTIASLTLILYIYLDITLRKRLKIETKLISMPLLFVQWYLLPVISFLLSSLPALDAHTRLLIGKKITYKVTEKV